MTACVVVDESDWFARVMLVTTEQIFTCSKLTKTLQIAVKFV